MGANNQNFDSLLITNGIHREEIKNEKLENIISFEEKIKFKKQALKKTKQDIESEKQAYEIKNQTYELLKVSKAAIVSSGTATLETAIIGTPQVVCYKSSYLSYKIAKSLVNIRFISLVNLIMDKEVVVELIQGDVSKNKIQKELDRLIYNDSYRHDLMKAYDEMIALLGNEGCSKKIARDLLGFYSR